MEAVIERLKEASPMAQIEALDSLLIYTQNLVRFPQAEKYRRVRVSNLHYQERLGHLDVSAEAMAAIGYVQDGDWMVFDEVARDPASEETLEYLRAAEQLLLARRNEVRDTFASGPSRLDEVAHVFTSVTAAASHSDQGKRHNMEDDEIIVDGFMGQSTSGYFGLYDGHGGRETVDFVVKALHLNLDRVLRGDASMDRQAALDRAYVQTDGQVRRANILQSGTTAVSCLVSVDATGRRVLFSANVGDSRAILVRGGKAIRLTIDHKPNLPEETKRIKDAGGFVIDKRVSGVLAISRALGDHMLKSNEVVSARPFCQATPLTSEDSHIVMACDGVWDVMTDQAAVDFVLSHLAQQGEPAEKGPALNSIYKRACEALVQEALVRKSMDNITALIVKL